MPKEIDFAGLTLQDALDLAIMIEEEAAERYEDLAAQMRTHHTPEAARFFEFMVVNETKHGRELLERRDALFGESPRNIDGSMIWEVEAPEYDKVHAFMTAREALDVALHAEEKAFDFFEAAVAWIREVEVRELFEELKKEEIEHQELVRREIAKLESGTPAAVSDLEDEPVAQ